MLRLPDSEEQCLPNSAAPAQQWPLLGTCGSDVPALLYLVSASETSWTVWLEKAMAPHSSTLAWKIPWTEEPGRLQSTGLLRVGHN